LTFFRLANALFFFILTFSPHAHFRYTNPPNFEKTTGGREARAIATVEKGR
jgi:hypothetical protein